MGTVNGSVKKFLALFFPIFLAASESNFQYLQNKNSVTGSFIDSDLDGVADMYDECPDTSFLDIVDFRGCSESQTPFSYYRFSLSSGFIYTKKKYYENFRKQHKKDDERKKDSGHFGSHMGNHNGGEKKEERADKKSYKEIYIPVNVVIGRKNFIYSVTSGYIKIKEDKEYESIADTYLSAGYVFNPSFETLWVFTLKAKVKLPSSDFSHKADYGIEGEVYKSYGRHSFFADAGYNALGSFEGYKNIYYFDMDYGYSLRKKDIGISYSFSFNTHNNKSIQNGTLYFSCDVTEDFKIYLGYTRAFFDSRDYESFALTFSRFF